MIEVAGELRKLADIISSQSGLGMSRDTHKVLPDYRALAEAAYRARRARDKCFGVDGLFSDPAWDILLDLVVAEGKQTKVSVSSACIASCVPMTTALRWLSILEKHCFIERAEDPADGRRVFVRLTDIGRKKVYGALCKDSNLDAI